MSERHRLAVYALLLIFLSNEVFSLTRFDYTRSRNTTQYNNWNNGAASQNPQQGSRYPPATGNQWTGGRYNQTYGNNNTTRYPAHIGSGQGSNFQGGQGSNFQGGQWGGAGRSNYTSPQFRPTVQPTSRWTQTNQTTHYYPGQNPQATNWNQFHRNGSNPGGQNTNWHPQTNTNWRPQTNSSWQPQPQPNSNWQPQSNSNWQRQPHYNATNRVTPTAPPSSQNNFGWNPNSNANNNLNSNFGGGQGQPNYIGSNVRPQNQSIPAWGGSHLYPTLQPNRPNQIPNDNSGGAALAPIGGSNNYNNQWNGNKAPNSADGGAALAPFGGGSTGSNGNAQWNAGNNWSQPGNLGGSSGNVPLAPLGTGSQWNAGGGQGSLSYGNGQQQPNSFGGAGQQRQGGANPYSNLFN